MPERPARRYWDSDCFLGWLAEEADKVDACRQVLDIAERGDIQIVTSALTLSEVLLMRGRSAVPASRRATVRGFFGRSYIVVVPIGREIAERSQDLVWDHGIRPKDALHVASAISTGLTLFNTFDNELIGKSRAEGLPDLTIERPGLGQGEMAV